MPYTEPVPFRRNRWLPDMDEPKTTPDTKMYRIREFFVSRTLGGPIGSTAVLLARRGRWKRVSRDAELAICTGGPGKDTL